MTARNDDDKNSSSGLKTAVLGTIASMGMASAMSVKTAQSLADYITTRSAVLERQLAGSSELTQTVIDEAGRMATQATQGDVYMCMLYGTAAGVTLLASVYSSISTYKLANARFGHVSSKDNI